MLIEQVVIGLKQASQNRYAKFSTAICKVGLTQSKLDYSLFTKFEGQSFTAVVLIYLDYMIIIGNDSEAILAFNKSSVVDTFKINLKYFWELKLYNQVQEYIFRGVITRWTSLMKRGC